MNSPIKNLLTLETIKIFDEELYNAHPELWDQEDLYLDGFPYTQIWEGKINRHFRLRQSGEKITPDYIQRSKRKIWEVGRIYQVRDNVELSVNLDDREILEQNKSWTKVSEIWEVSTKGETIGKLKLTYISPHYYRFLFWDLCIGAWLIFERADDVS